MTWKTIDASWFGAGIFARCGGPGNGGLVAGAGGNVSLTVCEAARSPEKYLYLFCVDADARDNDFVTVIDVNPDSATYGTIMNTVDLGTKGNETHHWGYTDDRTRIWAGGLFSNRIWIIDVATDPAKPRIEKVLDNISDVHAVSPARTAITRCRAGC